VLPAWIEEGIGIKMGREGKLGLVVWKKEETKNP